MPAGQEVAAVRGVVASLLGMVTAGATHLAVATDHVIESFRNRLWRGYKTSAGIEPALLSQFALLEEALAALGIVVWPMVEFEADDALAAGAEAASADPRVERVIICTPDKDLAQSVRGTRVVQLNRRTRVVMDEAGVIAKFGVPPASIPDYLALVGDSADGYPGLPGWGAKSAAAVLARFGHLESIPADPREWHVNVASAGRLAVTLAAERERAMLFRTLATLAHRYPAVRVGRRTGMEGRHAGLRAAGGAGSTRRCRQERIRSSGATGDEGDTGDQETRRQGDQEDQTVDRRQGDQEVDLLKCTLVVGL